MNTERGNQDERVGTFTVSIFKRVLDLPQGEIMRRVPAAGVEDAPSPKAEADVSWRGQQGQEMLSDRTSDRICGHIYLTLGPKEDPSQNLIDRSALLSIRREITGLALTQHEVQWLSPGRYEDSNLCEDKEQGSHAASADWK
ncbi:hypothetical protein B0H13DRAFT_2267736 [Mycena leptocephala]|nr:hypothetical protein B0H13DRAFT_2267736 [Mycena leptocephala]